MNITNLIKSHKTKSAQMERYATSLDGKVEYHSTINSPPNIYKYDAITVTIVVFFLAGASGDWIK